MSINARGGEASMPPPVPGTRSAAPAVAASRPYLYVIFNGQKIPVTKDEFIIGRGSRSADLPIKDGNISRRHAAIVWHNGSYYLKDLGSTNGIEFQGRRFETKRIDEGDLFRMCDYELRFTYQ
jgi:pSer/pThr/pTyr-binding forkhead associated (FHA) protein